MVLFSLVVCGQKNNPLRFRHITINEGLANNKVNAVCQDKDGFKWFGTDEGLNKYDGYEDKLK